MSGNRQVIRRGKGTAVTDTYQTNRHRGLGQLHHLHVRGDEREQRLHQDTAGTAYWSRRVQDGEFPDL